MRQHGFTLFELLITVSIVAITLAIALPGFNKLVKDTRLKTQSEELLHAVEQTRSTAVFSGRRAVLHAEEKTWHKGWKLFIDENDDGVLNDGEKILSQQEPMKDVIIKGNYHVKELVSFISNGEGRAPGKANRGEFTVGKLAICPEKEEGGYQINLSKGGRSRMEKLTAAKCSLAKQGKF